MGLTELLEEVEKLTPAEKEKVRSVLNSDPGVEGNLTEVERQELLVKKLYERGMIKSIPDRTNRSRVSRPVPIMGEPLSETIIAERR